MPLTRKELSKAYGMIENRYKRASRALHDLSLNSQQMADIEKILSEAQSAEGRKLLETPAVDVKEHTTETY